MNLHSLILYVDKLSNLIPRTKNYLNRERLLFLKKCNGYGSYFIRETSSVQLPDFVRDGLNLLKKEILPPYFDNDLSMIEKVNDARHYLNLPPINGRYEIEKWRSMYILPCCVSSDWKEENDDEEEELMKNTYYRYLEKEYQRLISIELKTLWDGLLFLRKKYAYSVANIEILPLQTYLEWLIIPNLESSGQELSKISSVYPLWCEIRTYSSPWNDSGYQSEEKWWTQSSTTICNEIINADHNQPSQSIITKKRYDLIEKLYRNAPLDLDTFIYYTPYPKMESHSKEDYNQLCSMFEECLFGVVTDKQQRISSSVYNRKLNEGLKLIHLITYRALLFKLPTLPLPLLPSAPSLVNEEDFSKFDAIYDKLMNKYYQLRINRNVKINSIMEEEYVENVKRYNKLVSKNEKRRIERMIKKLWNYSPEEMYQLITTLPSSSSINQHQFNESLKNEKSKKELFSKYLCALFTFPKEWVEEEGPFPYSNETDQAWNKLIDTHSTVSVENYMKYVEIWNVGGVDEEPIIFTNDEYHREIAPLSHLFNSKREYYLKRIDFEKLRYQVLNHM